MRKISKKFVWLALFGIAMGYLEASVVCYLRELYCPAGFSFPLAMPPTRIFLAELGREASTIVMLLALSVICNPSFITRLACFCFLFAVWDIFYYFWLYVLLKWPSSLFTWDILFSIPVSWAAPVIVPLIVSLLLIVFSVIIFHLNNAGKRIKFIFMEKMLLLAGILLVFLSMTIDAFLEPKIYLSQTPGSFHWPLFLSGTAIFVIVMIFCLRTGVDST